jgi:hypothetical protein
MEFFDLVWLGRCNWLHGPSPLVIVLGDLSTDGGSLLVEGGMLTLSRAWPLAVRCKRTVLIRSIPIQNQRLCSRPRRPITLPGRGEGLTASSVGTVRVPVACPATI